MFSSYKIDLQIKWKIIRLWVAKIAKNGTFRYFWLFFRMNIEKTTLPDFLFVKYTCSVGKSNFFEIRWKKNTTLKKILLAVNLIYRLVEHGMKTLDRKFLPEIMNYHSKHFHKIVIKKYKFMSPWKSSPSLYNSRKFYINFTENLWFHRSLSHLTS